MTSQTSNNALSSPQTPPVWSEVRFTFSDRNTDSELAVMCNAKLFIIRLSADNLSESPKLRACYLFFLKVAEEFELDGVTVKDFWDWIIGPLLPIFRKLPTPDKAVPPTLNDFFNPETFIYTLRAVSDKLVPQLDRDSQPGFMFVQICQENVVNPPSHTPRKVRLNDGTIAFLKLVHRGDKQFLKNELDTYRKIDGAQLDNMVRISRLHGLVRNNDRVIFGLLLTYID
ncbi:Serine/threonine-protein kinase PKH1, partial [Fusarium austroafricanum]